MKLSAHYTKASIFASLAILFAGAFIYYFALKYTANTQLDKNLNQVLTEADNYARISGLPPQQYDLDQDHVVFIKTHEKYIPKRFFDTLYRNLKEARIEDGRAVEDIITVNDIHYKVIITISRESTSYLIEIISTITLTLIAGLIIILFITNKYILKGLWKPFYDTLNQIKAFNVADVSQFNLKPDKVDEFTELNGAIHEMSLRVKNDYQNLKQFTENASHEMMTPLAVITTKLDTLIQDETLRPDQLAQITDIYTSINKSTRLNQSLLLLVKLDNNLIKDGEQINLEKIISEKIIQLQEIIQAKNITVQASVNSKQLTANKYLIDILLNNLFSNAINHNHNGGTINIGLTGSHLIIKNTGVNSPLPLNLVFERFQKGKASNGSGLGLTLAKNICQYYGFTIAYEFDNDQHIFTVNFIPINNT